MLSENPPDRPTAEEVAKRLRIHATEVLDRKEERARTSVTAAAQAEVLALEERHGEELTRVKRELSKATLPIPPYWSCGKQGAATAGARPLDPLHSRVITSKFMIPKLQACMRGSRLHDRCGGGQLSGGLRVTRVLRVECVPQWQQYCTKKGIMQSKAARQPCPRVPAVDASHAELHAQCAQDVNEVYLFHGTSGATAQVIAKHGFDERVASMGGLYGAGIYFAENSCKAHQYAQRGRPNDQGEYVMFYSRVLLGNAQQVHAQFQGRRPDLIPGQNGETYDSVLAGTQARGGQQAHREYVVFDRCQVYPEFIIYYQV